MTDAYRFRAGVRDEAGRVNERSHVSRLGQGAFALSIASLAESLRGTTRRPATNRGQSPRGRQFPRSSRASCRPEET
jgi:hypothetical protein